MFPVYLAIFIFTILALFQPPNKPVIIHGQLHVNYGKRAIWTCGICFLIIFVLHSFVNPYFSDLLYYTKAFQNSENYSWEFLLFNNIPGLKAEVGFRIFCKLISSITTTPLVFLMASSLLILYGFYEVTRKYSPMLMLSVLLIMTEVFMQSVFVLRQYIAMGIILLSYPYIINKKIWPFLGILTLAYLFHQTAIVFLPVFFLYKIKNKKLLFVSMIIGGIIISASLATIFKFYVTNFAMTTASYGEEYLTTSEKGLNYTMATMNILILSFRLIVMKSKAFLDGINRLLTIIISLGCILTLVGIGFTAIARLALYFTALNFLIIPNTICYFKNNAIRIGAGVSFFILSFYIFLSYVRQGAFDEIWFFSREIY